MPSEQEKTERRARVEAAKDALSRSAGLGGAHVPPARAALKNFLRQLNEPVQPNDAVFKVLIEAPFREIPVRSQQRR